MVSNFLRRMYMKKSMLLGLLLSVMALSSLMGMEEPAGVQRSGKVWRVPAFPWTAPVYVRSDSLIAAAQINSLPVVKILIKSGVDVNKRDQNGKSALDYAKENKNQAMIDALIEAGATIEKEKLK